MRSSVNANAILAHHKLSVRTGLGRPSLAGLGVRRARPSASLSAPSQVRIAEAVPAWPACTRLPRPPLLVSPHPSYLFAGAAHSPLVRLGSNGDARRSVSLHYGHRPRQTQAQLALCAGLRVQNAGPAAARASR